MWPTDNDAVPNFNKNYTFYINIDSLLIWDRSPDVKFIYTKPISRPVHLQVLPPPIYMNT